MSKKKKAAVGAKADPILSFTKVYVEKHLKNLKKTSERNEMYELLVEFMEPFIRLHHKDIHDDMMANHHELLNKIAHLEAKIDRYEDKMSSLLCGDSEPTKPCPCGGELQGGTIGDGFGVEPKSMQIREEAGMSSPEDIGDFLDHWFPEGSE